MDMDHRHVWEECRSIIKKNINEQSYKTWFEPIKSIKHEDNVLTIQVPNKFFYEWLEEHYVTILKTAMHKIMGDGARLEYQYLVENHRQIGKIDQAQKAQNDLDIRNPFVIPGIKKLDIDPKLNKKYRFDNFIEGDCNKLARSAGKAIAKNPGSTAFNPLVVFGDVGLGKTHLAQAIGNEIVNNHPKCQVLYVPTEKFTNQVVDAVKSNSLNDFMHFYQMIDVLIVDDIQFLAKKPKTQEIFFNIFNELHQCGKQIILTSDRPPKDLRDVEKRLTSRFKWGLNADLATPDFSTRKAIFESKMDHVGVNLDDEISDYVCYNIENNIRELEGVLISLIAQSSLNGKHIDLHLTKDVIRQFISQVNKEITIDNIKKLVAEHFSVPIDKLQAKSRKREVVMARQLSMYLAKSFTNQSLKNIGKNFGNRDHSTVIYSVQAVKDLIDTDALFKSTVNKLEKKVKMSIHN